MDFSLAFSLGIVLEENIETNYRIRKLKNILRYVDNTRFLAKEYGINNIFDKINSFRKNVKSTMDCLDDQLHFLNITIDKPDTDPYYNDPWNYKTW